MTAIGAVWTAVSLVVLGAYMSFLERRILARFQRRHGPTRVGWMGLLQLPADVVKMLFKEDWIPPFSEKLFFVLSPAVAFCLPLLTFAVVPMGETNVVVRSRYGLLFVLAMMGWSAHSVLFAGWSSRNRYSLLGAMRTVVQAIGYEAFLGLSVVGVAARARSFDLVEIVRSQRALWNVVPQCLGFVTFFVAAIAVCHRHPFDQPESEQELCDGYHVEYSGMKFGLFFIGEYIHVVVASAVAATLFWGGWQGSYFSPLFHFGWKTALLGCVFVWCRASLPRPHSACALRIGWTVGVPLSLLNLFVTAVGILHEA